jgi:hypothetical protein
VASGRNQRLCSRKATKISQTRALRKWPSDFVASWLRVIRIRIDSCALIVISTGGRYPPSCHLDRRPPPPLLSSRPEAKAGAERSGCERAVSGVCAKVHRSGQESFRPRGPSRYGATSDSRPDVSTPPGRTAALRAGVAPKDIGFAGDKENSPKYRTDRELSWSNPHAPRLSGHQPRSGLATRHDRRRGSLRST